jgi:FtsP/CotA-like multicopper oxidase with cupredoxin domain
MNRKRLKNATMVTGVLAALLLFWMPAAQAVIHGVEDLSPAPVFSLVVKKGQIVTSDGDTFPMWGYALDTGGPMQYPGPTFIVRQGALVTVNLRNELPAGSGNVSMVFPGHNVSASDGGTGAVAGLLAAEAPPGGTVVVTYQFTATNAGTYMYHSGTMMDIQIEMGLVGALIVRPAAFDPATPATWTAYGDPGTLYEREFLYLLTEMDPQIHRYVEFGQFDQVDTTNYFATNWFINGRNFPDLMADAFVPWLPTQPYNCQPRMKPGERVLIRFVGAGRDLHPMHLHGNNFSAIAVDGRVLSSTGGNNPDLEWKATTKKVVPGQTADLLWTWNAQNLGWDIYGHAPGDPTEPGEFLADHGKPFPVILPARDDLSFGAFYSGSPFLGGKGSLPPEHAGLNANGGFFYMWHSHTEKELTSNDIWPGGYVTFMIVEPPSATIP